MKLGLMKVIAREARKFSLNLRH